MRILEQDNDTREITDCGASSESMDIRDGHGNRSTIDCSDLRQGERRFIGTSEDGKSLYAVGE